MPVPVQCIHHFQIAHCIMLIFSIAPNLFHRKRKCTRNTQNLFFFFIFIFMIETLSTQQKQRTQTKRKQKNANNVSGHFLHRLRCGSRTLVQKKISEQKNLCFVWLLLFSLKYIIEIQNVFPISLIVIQTKRSKW